MQIPENKQKILGDIVDDLKQLDGVVALVLGGSYSTGNANENSDLDIGIYYHEKTPFSIEGIKNISKKYQIDDTLTVTDFYVWGTWVNGGAWIHTTSGEVDLLYKNIDQIKRTIESSKNGIFENDYEQQPPYGFSSVIYLAETHYCIPLYDPENIIQKLKNEVKDYPLKLKQTIIQNSLWSAEFTLWQADKFAKKSDLYNTVGCISRALKNIVDALFAINELYSMGDKNAIKVLEDALKQPEKLVETIEQVLSVNQNSLKNNVGVLRNLFEQTVSLANGAYRPYFKL
ncbi:nucleotidyltransferase domain-containing protein [Leptospira perdikensis]|uniref:DUF4037 domain-containing protein n=1 Tax=Leptospira perdikensis TaxID=2484948 RepID=A0A4V3JP39_9LEPT|nr:nucleotidyltransferase domain-containing protein [Leptospira perdikensis]TGL38952.1 DUF4037 domain-containing protein [Leptospira perdikensis]